MLKRCDIFYKRYGRSTFARLKKKTGNLRQQFTVLRPSHNVKPARYFDAYKHKHTDNNKYT